MLIFLGYSGSCRESYEILIRSRRRVGEAKGCFRHEIVAWKALRWIDEYVSSERRMWSAMK